MMRIAVLAGMLWGWILPFGAVSSEGSGLCPPQWREVSPGISFTRVEATRFWRGGSRRIGVVRLDPAVCRIEPYHESEFPGRAQASARVWQERLAVQVIFNAGLYDESRTHLGTLLRGRQNVGGVAHPRWKGVLVSDSDLQNGPRAKLLDLSIDTDREQVSGYANAVQTMMLFDRAGEIRVRRTERTAARTVMAEGDDGRLYVFVTEGHYTLWETAKLLRESGWGLTAAIALDGGNEANLAVRGNDVNYSSSDLVIDSRERFIRINHPLPAVIAVSSTAPGSRR